MKKKKNFLNLRLQDCEQHRYWEWEDMQAELFKI